MRFFLNNHPYLAAAMLGMICLTIIKTTYIIATDGEVEDILPKFMKKEEKDEIDEEVEE